MKKRRRKNNNYFIYLLVAAMIIASFSIGYSLLNSSLNVSGTAHTTDFVSGPILKINLIKTGARYTTGTIPTNIIYQSEILNQNNLTVNFNRADAKATRYNVSLTITFSNAYSYHNLTSGTASVQLISGSNVQGLTKSLGKIVLIPGEIGTLTVNFSNTNKAGANIRATMSYIVYGITQYFYYNIVIA